jgi:hypothetical protein
MQTFTCFIALSLLITPCLFAPIDSTTEVSTNVTTEVSTNVTTEVPTEVTTEHLKGCTLKGMTQISSASDYFLCSREGLATLFLSSVDNFDETQTPFVSLIVTRNQIPQMWNMADGFICQVIYAAHGIGCFQNIPALVLSSFASSIAAAADLNNASLVTYSGQNGYCVEGMHALTIGGADTALRIDLVNAYESAVDFCKIEEYKTRFIFRGLWFGLAFLLLIFVGMFVVLLAIPSLMPLIVGIACLKVFCGTK